LGVLFYRWKDFQGCIEKQNTTLIAFTNGLTKKISGHPRRGEVVAPQPVLFVSLLVKRISFLFIPISTLVSFIYRRPESLGAQRFAVS
jgi:hypothetical protein